LLWREGRGKRRRGGRGEEERGEGRGEEERGTVGGEGGAWGEI
jgi:hypothetical protein